MKLMHWNEIQPGDAYIGGDGAIVLVVSSVVEDDGEALWHVLNNEGRVLDFYVSSFRRISVPLYRRGQQVNLILQSEP